MSISFPVSTSAGVLRLAPNRADLWGFLPHRPNPACDCEAACRRGMEGLQGGESGVDCDPVGLLGRSFGPMRTLAKNATKARNKAKPPGERQYQTNGRCSQRSSPMAKHAPRRSAASAHASSPLPIPVAPAPCTTTGAAPFVLCTGYHTFVAQQLRAPPLRLEPFRYPRQRRFVHRAADRVCLIQRGDQRVPRPPSPPRDCDISSGSHHRTPIARHHIQRTSGCSTKCIPAERFGCSPAQKIM